MMGGSNRLVELGAWVGGYTWIDLDSSLGKFDGLGGANHQVILANSTLI